MPLTSLRFRYVSSPTLLSALFSRRFGPLRGVVALLALGEADVARLWGWSGRVPVKDESCWMRAFAEGGRMERKGKAESSAHSRTFP